MKIAQYIGVVAMLLHLGCAADSEQIHSDDLDAGGGAACLQVATEDLQDLTVQALALVPDFLREDFATAMRAQSGARQDALANLILQLDDLHFVDEIAFVIAHSRRSIIADPGFMPELLLENVQYIYWMTDPDNPQHLHYVERIERGTPSLDCDFATTLRYRMRDAQGQDRWVELPEDIYYWSVVHPVMEDESPLYIDPEKPFVSHNSAAEQGFAPPPVGQFWRSYLYTMQDPVCPYDDDDPNDDRLCPSLREALAGADILWSGEQNDVGEDQAIGAVTHWLNAVMDFGANGTRPIQPVRIYHEHDGNCGEYADITTAAGRTALIPTVNVYAFLWDHTWNEFWSEGWHQWEPYQAEANDPVIRAVDHVDHWWDHRGAGMTMGDGRLVDVSEHYTDQLAHLQVAVVDAEGLPVADAWVTFIGENNGNCCFPFFFDRTDAAGFLDILVGVEGEPPLFKAFVEKGELRFPADDGEAVQITVGALPDETYKIDVVLQ